MIEFSNEENMLIDNCFTLAIKATREVGKIAEEGYSQGLKKIEFKQPGKWDLVTEYDRRIEQFLMNEITKIYPEHKFVAEETSANNLLSDAPTWIIDPIDGTNSFVHGLPFFAISVAMSLKKQLVIGIVYNPILNEMYTARLGAGSFLNDKPIKCSNVDNLDESLFVHELSFVKHEQFRECNIKRIYKFASICPGSRSFGGAALTLAYVARGSVDCYQIDALKPWDTAAGVLLVTEAGGRVYKTDGSKFFFMEPFLLCGATEQLCQQMIACIKEADHWNLRFE